MRPTISTGSLIRCIPQILKSIWSISNPEPFKPILKVLLSSEKYWLVWESFVIYIVWMLCRYKVLGYRTRIDWGRWWVLVFQWMGATNPSSPCTTHIVEEFKSWKCYRAVRTFIWRFLTACRRKGRVQLGPSSPSKPNPWWRGLFKERPKGTTLVISSMLPARNPNPNHVISYIYDGMEEIIFEFFL